MSFPDHRAPSASSSLPPPPSSPRRIAVRPPIVTQTPFAHAALHTPASAASSGPFSPYAASSAANSPMAVPYNPQQWNRGPQPGPHYVPHTQLSIAPTRARDISGMEESMPSPPPPYSPGQIQNQNQNISQTLVASPHLSSNAFPQNHPPPPPPPPQTGTPPSARSVRSYHTRPASITIPSSSSSPASNPQFAPPPVRAGKERSSSRGQLSTKFSLSSFRNRNNDSSPVPSAIESLHMSTSDALQRAPADPGPSTQRNFLQYGQNSPMDQRWLADSESPSRPPASRRAASAGVLGRGTESRTPVDETPTNMQARWGPGMPLPPPPPGPPPSSSRSQSMGPGVETSRTLGLPSAPPTRRPGQSTLGPIPPTPMGWEDEPTNQTNPSATYNAHASSSSYIGHQQEHAGVASEIGNASTSSGPSSSSHSNSTIHRTSTRDSSVQGIRERRNASRAARERNEPSNNPWAQDLEGTSAIPANLELASPDTGLTRRGAVTKSTPRSGGGLRSPRSAHLFDEPGSANSTPRMNSYQRVVSGAAPTPPFSPGTENVDYLHTQKLATSLPQKALPTPPLRPHGSDIGPDLTGPSGVANRSASQASARSNARTEDPTTGTPKQTDADVFARASMERHRQFIENEMQAETDEQRLELFAEFIVTESRFRRDRYSGAFDAMAGEVMDLTRDLWRSYGNSGRRAVTPGTRSIPAVPSSSHSQASVAGDFSDTGFTHSIPTTAASPASSRGNCTPHTELDSPSSATSQRARDASWANNYHPSLSPIPSMAMSTIPDEEDSRGRSASRWWESDDGSTGIGNRRLERSKRESKYMGLAKEARENLQWDGEDQPTPKYRDGSSSRPEYGPNDYPVEKAGSSGKAAQGELHQSNGYYSTPAAATPDSHKLDVSRLVTLPPPYPRHHPAVNNNHPELASIRSSLRTVSSLEEAKTTKAGFETKVKSRQESESASLRDRRSQIRYNIQENLRNGVMTFADAAQADADFESREHKRAQDVVQGVFDTFQVEVANPLHAMFCERITRVTASMEHIKGRLSNEAQQLNPNQTQEEGDEQPELLEMLTLLKWLFEAREQLHKELFELENERNDLYRDIIVLPYVQAKNDQKVQEARNFFQRDAQDRKVVFQKEILKRYESLLEVIEQNVTRGVETQLSAFWDIAPGLLDIVQKVPQQLDSFDIVIPPQEYQENPAFHEFPLQYLYTVLAHAGRSAYQFMESQTNLLCLLHEVKTGVMTAGSRLLHTQRLLEGEDEASVDEETKAIRADEERRLTDDLKEKVGLVESQWDEALGQGLKKCKMMVEEFLSEQGGWDEGLSE